MTLGAYARVPLPPGRERKSLVRRCIAAWVDTEEVTRAEWESMFTPDIKSEALHKMRLDQLRARDE